MEQESQSKVREQEMFALIAMQKASAMSVRDFCMHHGLSRPSYYYWQKRYRASQQAGHEEPDGFTLLKKERESLLSQSHPGSLFAEYKGIKIYQQVSACFLRELIGSER